MTAADGIPYGNGEQLAERPDLGSFFDLQIVAPHHDADAVLFQVERVAGDAPFELDHLAVHHAGEAVNACNAVADFQHRADLADIELALVFLDLHLDDGGNLVCIDSHGYQRS